MPIATKTNLHDRTNETFTIRPFNLECSTATTTSHSSRRKAMSNYKAAMDKTQDHAKYYTQDVHSLCEKKEIPKISSPVHKTHLKDNFEPVKIKIRCNNANLNKIKLKFRRRGGLPSLKDLDVTCRQPKADIVNLKGMTSNLNMSKIVNYSTQEHSQFKPNADLDDLCVPDSDIEACTSVDSPFKVTNFMSTPRKTAYFGQ